MNLEDMTLQAAVLSGNFGETPEDADEAARASWEIAKAWDAALKKRSAIRPSDIVDMEKLDQLRQFEEDLCPFGLANKVMLKRQSSEVIQKKRAETEKRVIEFLQKHGF